MVPNWFNLDTYVHTVWTGSAGNKYTFYKNGAVVDGTPAGTPAPATFSLHDSYTIGRVGCSNDNIGCYDQQPTTGTIDQVEFYDFAMATGDVGSKYTIEKSAAGCGDGGDAAPPAVPDTCVDYHSADNTQYDKILDPTLSASKAITFSVKAKNDAHIGFFSAAGSMAEVYEIVLSGWGNTQSVIRESNQGANRYNRPLYLNIG